MTFNASLWPLEKGHCFLIVCNVSQIDLLFFPLEACKSVCPIWESLDKLIFILFFPHLGCKTRILIQKWLIVLVATSDNLICNLACASVDRSISSSKKSLCVIDLQVMKEFSSCASLCVCLPLENDSAVFVIHHSVFVSCHSLDLFFPLECYSSLLNLWLVLRHGVFSGTTSMSTVASAFWESLCVCVYLIMPVFACVRGRDFGCLSDFTFESWAVLFIVVKPK